MMINGSKSCSLWLYFYEQSMHGSVGTDCQGVYDGIYLVLRLFCCAQSFDLSGCETTLRDDVFTLKYPFFSQLRPVCSIGKIEVDRVSISSLLFKL
jgi:hypothetical protein